MDPWAWYRRGKIRAIDALEAGEITYREYLELRQEALETLEAMVEDLEDEDEVESLESDGINNAVEFWKLNLAELAERCTLAECDPICLAYGRPEICGRTGHV